MSAFSDDLLAARFALLAPEPLEGDWLDVQRRARRQGRRRTVALLVAAALATLVVGSALAFGPRIVDFFSAEPAPEGIVMQFKDGRRALKAEWGASYPAIESEARTIIDVRRSDGSSAYIAVAPARGGGFCTEVTTGAANGAGSTGTSCANEETLRKVPVDPGGNAGTTAGDEQTSWRNFAGYVAARGAERLVLRYEDGGEDDMPFVWVSPPIDAGFFAFDPSGSHDAKGHRAKAVVALGAGGTELGRFDFTYTDPADPWIFPRGKGMPPAIDPATVEPLEIPGLPSWAMIQVGKGRAGGLCFRISGGHGGGCVQPGVRPSCCEVGGFDTPGGRRHVLVSGITVPDAVMELRYQDGREDWIRPVDQVIVYAIPIEQFPEGHRLVSGVVRDADGTVVDHVKWDPRWGQGYFG